MKQRLDKRMLELGLVTTRSQAENWIRLGKVTVDGVIVKKTGTLVGPTSKIKLNSDEQYVSRAGLKLASVAEVLGVDFRDKVVLDVGSSTGGFTDYALQHGAKKVYAVDVGTDQLHPSLRDDPRIELHEKTDIRDFVPEGQIDIVVIDVSFISLRQILPAIRQLLSTNYHLPTATYQILAMVKPQFEADRRQLTKTGIVKNDRARRDILLDFEYWVKQSFLIVDKADSAVAGTHGNRERFYLLDLLQK